MQGLIPRDQLCTAFDGIETAYALVQGLTRYRAVTSWMKYSPSLDQTLDRVVERGHDAGYRVFSDPKYLDIPSTVARNVAAAARRGVDMLTVHARGGSDMLRAAKDAAGTMRLAAVTTMTSELLDEQAARAQTIEYARAAYGEGITAVVTAGLFVPLLREHVSADLYCIVPGIRSDTIAGDDQRWTCTPQEAIAYGADLLVLGRALRALRTPDAVRAFLAQ